MGQKLDNIVGELTLVNQSMSHAVHRNPYNEPRITISMDIYETREMGRDLYEKFPVRFIKIEKKKVINDKKKV